MKKNWYLMKNIKSNFPAILLVVVSFVTLSSCSLDPIDKTYNRHTAEDDFRRIKEISSTDSSDVALLAKYMVEHQLAGQHVTEIHTTYRHILDEAKKEKELHEIEKRKKGKKNEMDIAKSHENEKIKNINKVLLVDFVKKDTAFEEENIITPKKGKKTVAAPVNKNVLVYEVMFKNIGDKPIKAFKGDLDFVDVFNSEIKKVTYSSFEEIQPDGYITQKFTIYLDEVNSSGNVYNDLKKDVIKVKWFPDRLITTDENGGEVIIE